MAALSTSAVDPRRVAVVDRLLAAGCVAAEEEADELLLAARDVRTLEAWVRRREHGEPMAWITGTLTFCGQTLYVAPGVYVPRHQTEELARRAAALLPPRGLAVDLCTGAGAVAVHLQTAVPKGRVVGVDIDMGAARCARRNRVQVVVGDLDEPLRPRSGVALVTAVAPYVPTAAIALLPADVQRYEPLRSLDGGPDGLDLVRRVVAAAARLLRPGGWLLAEVGGDQDEALAPALSAAGFTTVTPWHDDDGDLRGFAARLGRA